MDAFYAAVEVCDNPNLAGLPLVIGAPPDKRGVVCTASYEARKYGIHSAMPSRTAGKLCPRAVFLEPRFPRYVQVSEQIMAILDRFTPVVEQLSVDEAFMDVRGALRKWKDPLALARALKARIRADCGLTASVGVAPNKFLAKLSSDLDKPDGLTLAPEQPDEIARFLAPLPITRIWGVGRKTAERLASFGLRTIGDAQQRGYAFLKTILGETAAEHVHELAFGRDDRPVITEREAKSISSETTFDEDCNDPDLIRQTLIEQAEHVGARLRRSGREARVGHIKLRFEDFRTVTRQEAFGRRTDTDQSLIRCALRLLEREKPAQPVRLIGFGVSGFESVGGDFGGWLFQEPRDEKNRRLDAAVDQVRSRFGAEKLKRGRI